MNTQAVVFFFYHFADSTQCKLTVVLVFATMLFIVCESKVNEIILKTAFTTALLSAVDEYLIILTSGKIDIDRRSFFSGKTTQKRS